MTPSSSAMALTILGYFTYHIFQKSVAASVHPVVAIIMAYGTGLIFGLVLLFFLKNPLEALSTAKHANWAVYGIGLAVFTMEMGFLLSYRSGWHMSIGVTVCNTVVTLLLIPVGIFFFREHLNMLNTLGIVLCLGGLTLLRF